MHALITEDFEITVQCVLHLLDFLIQPMESLSSG